MDVPVHGTHAANPEAIDQLSYRGTYNLAKGKWQTAFGYRHFRSFRHFVGSVEQNAENVAKGLAERDRSGTNVINHVYQPSVGASYGVTDQLSVSAELPYFHAHRRSPGPPTGTNPTYVTVASGISDLTLTGRYWVADPKKHSHQNVSVGLGVKFPTGNDQVEDEFLVRVVNGQRITEVRPVDQSIQPGDGGWGILTELQAFKAFGRFVGFVSGSYLMNPQETNDFLRSGPNTTIDRSGANNHLLSIADQYAARIGVATSVKKNVGVNLGLRWEGTRGSDLIGGDRGRRRPGYTLGIDPGVTYSWSGNFISLNVPWAIRRVRNQNYADKLESLETGHFENGDAAFADYAIVVGFSRRF